MCDGGWKREENVSFGAVTLNAKDKHVWQNHKVAGTYLIGRLFNNFTDIVSAHSSKVIIRGGAYSSICLLPDFPFCVPFVYCI